jgi:hypothetical protein
VLVLQYITIWLGASSHQLLLRNNHTQHKDDVGGDWDEAMWDRSEHSRTSELVNDVATSALCDRKSSCNSQWSIVHTITSSKNYSVEDRDDCALQIIVSIIKEWVVESENKSACHWLCICCSEIKSEWNTMDFCESERKIDANKISQGRNNNLLEHYGHGQTVD